jgi:monoamine oxidase
VTRALMREAGLSLVPIEGTRWGARNGAFSPNDSQLSHATLLHRALSELKTDLPIAEFLKQSATNGWASDSVGRGGSRGDMGR